MYLKQSTAVTIRIGPFIDEDDGKTAELLLAIAQANIRVSKAGGAFAQSGDVSGATHDENGWYYLQLSTGDVDTVGRIVVAIHVSGALPVWKEFFVVPANVYNLLTFNTHAELSAVPSLPVGLPDLLMWIFELARNEMRSASNNVTLIKDDGVTTLAEATVTAVGSVAVRNKYAT